MKFLMVMILASLVSVSALAADSCALLKQELKSLQKTQAVMMTSLVNNHETFASTLEEYSATVQEQSGSQKISQNMNQSAEAFRRRGLQGKKMAAQLNEATADLLTRVAACL